MSPPAKKARKSFEDHTIAELSDLVKQQEKASKDHAAKVADLEEQLDELKENSSPESAQAERLLNAIDSQLSVQMVPDNQLSEGEKEKLRKDGRDIVAIMPNVGQNLMQAIGLDKVDEKGQPKTKYAQSFLNKVPVKMLPGGASLKLLRSLDFKYVKGRCELKVTGTYKWFPKPRPKAKRVKKQEVAEGEEDDEGEEEDGDEEEDGAENEEEGGEKDEAEGAAAPKAKAKRGRPKAKAKAKPKESKPAGNYKVVVCGGAGGIGQPLAMHIAMDSNVKDLAIFDLDIAMVPAAGVAADLSHLERKCSVKGYQMKVGEKPIDHTEECLTGAHVVLIPAGIPRKPGMTRDDLFKTNADIAKGLVEACAKYCPEAMLLLIVNPVNSVVPAMCELYKKKGLDHKKIIGVTTLDCVRANKFVGEITGKNPSFINVPVIGGHAGSTIMPVFSQDKTAATIDKEKIEALDKRVQDAGTEVVNAKNGKGSATLSMAYAGARLARSVIAGLQGRRRTECAYVASDITDLPYFTSKVVFGDKGVMKVLGVGDLNDYEKKRLEEASAQLKTEIQTGVDYAAKNDLA